MRLSNLELCLGKLLLSDENRATAFDIDGDQEEFSGGQFREIFDRLRRSPHQEAIHAFSVAHADSTVGFFVLREAPALPDWAFPGVMTLHNFRISRQFQRQGLGAATVRKMAQWVADNRPAVSQLMLSVNSGNEQALAFYRSCSFRATGVTLDGRISREMIMASEIAALLVDAELAARPLE
ncbi:ribosomal protein S18 acetylase RimI-like enzyme [Aminobacter aminovorans]|uniref:Ribosomal-protein-alanine acetyltransferase n=1 Tax=Aminobacter aminovorans TaxID=83263 RepID=A0A381ILL0_AMIAI|nr:GNAT family N-acetyltransferase [Aminobacter aminovorans]TCS20503.1 ribosomal protein S18 acetylase RimI-like enzyme [Aminobacter aminovorans]SUY28284.1 ribosomal-protein-alanine acetyltransferase [Aminobacter aminovorans]